MLTAPGDDVADSGLVFISYSHDDAAWAQRFRVLLKPLVRRKHLRLWDDTSIRVGDEWHPAIGRAIERSRVALLLVSADFLASDYVMERELPALRSNGVVLAPVLVGDCFWAVVPELTTVQWLHDVGRDGPLGLELHDPAERDRRIHRACDRLLTVAPDAILDDAATPATAPPPRAAGRIGRWRGRRRTPEGAPPDSHRTPHGRRRLPGPARDGVPAHGLPPSAAPPVVAELLEGDRRGALSRVPALPPSYVVRDELDELVGAVVGVSGGGAVGLTASPADVGLHGLGGIGKSVLATAVANDDRIRRRFPDGVYWVTVGERPDLLALQLELLARLRLRAAARTPTEATAALRAALAPQRVLLVIDDVWSDAAAQAFRVTGPSGRLLYTSRDPGVVRAAGAVAHQVGVLSPAAARMLAATVLDMPATSLPSVADRAFEAVGRVPLAVALLTAAVRAGRPWIDVAADLARDADVYGAHPYADTFRALHIATTALPADLRAALLGLAVFPPDTAIPVVAIGRYWAHTRDRTLTATGDDLDLLAAAKVLQRDRDTDGVDTVGFHDLAHEYLLLHADGLPSLHAQLLQAYGRLLSDGEQWWQLPPDEPYIWEHLAAHLAGAGDRLTLARTVTDPAYQAQRIARDGPYAGEGDLTLAARLRPDETVIDWWRAWLARHPHILGRAATGAPDTRRARVASTMLAWLNADPARPVEVRPARLAPLLPRPYVAVSGGLDTPSTALVRVLTGHTDAVRAVAWSADGTQLVTAGRDGTLRSWNPVTGEILQTHTKFPRWPDDIAWSPNGTRLATTGKNIRIWNPATGEVVHTLRQRSVDAVAWSPDGSRLVIAVDGTIRTWSPVSGDTVITPAGGTADVNEVTWSSDGTQLAFAGGGSVRIANAVAGSPLRTVINGPNLALAWSARGNRLAAADLNGTIQVWDPATDRVATLVGHTDWVNAMGWSPDGRRLAVASEDGTVAIWKVKAERRVISFKGHKDYVRAVAWSPDGAQLATASDDKTLRLWDPTTGRCTATLEGHTDEVTGVAWSRDGAYLASMDASGLLIIWDSTDRQASSLVLQPSECLAWSAATIAVGQPGRPAFLTLRDPADLTT